MSKTTLKKTIKKELDALNWKIDLKIIRGLSYKQEARRHKFLLAQFEYLNRSVREENWFSGFAGKLGQVAASFVL